MHSPWQGYSFPALGRGTLYLLPRVDAMVLQNAGGCELEDAQRRRRRAVRDVGATAMDETLGPGRPRPLPRLRMMASHAGQICCPSHRYRRKTDVADDRLAKHRTRDSGRLLAALGPAPSLRLAYLADPDHKGTRRWPLRTSSQTARAGAKEMLSPSQRQVLAAQAASSADVLSAVFDARPRLVGAHC